MGQLSRKQKIELLNRLASGEADTDDLIPEMFFIAKSFLPRRLMKDTSAIKGIMVDLNSGKEYTQQEHLDLLARLPGNKVDGIVYLDKNIK